MALRALMKRKELNDAQKKLDELREKAKGFETREAEIEKMIEEAESEEERAAVQEEIDAFEKERGEVNGQIEELEETIRGIEQDLEEIEKDQNPESTPAPAEDAPTEERRKEIMNRRNVFAKVDHARRAAIFEDENVKAFLGEIRSAMKEKRAISGAGLLVPEVITGFIRENILEYSKLYKHVNLRQISGNGREIVEGTIPEAVWTDCCANVNELGLEYNDAEVFCWNVGGYLPVCRSTIMDSDIDLASEIITVLGAAIGLALDKAILYGLGTRMPMGIVTRLAQTAAPEDYPATARTWEDLHTKNLSKTDKTGTALFQAILMASGAAKGKYSRGTKVWVMNDTTYTYLRAQGLGVDASGAIVSGIDGTMPVAGGVVEVLDFVPDYNIIGGYFDLYLLAEREGINFEESDHVMFLNRKRVYMANARYDGQPVIAEGFVVIGVNNATPTTTVEFAADTANS